MKFLIRKTKENLVTLMRKAGYFALNPEIQKEKDILSFIRPLERGGYPRFHIYISSQEDELVFNLHLDQKKPIYKSAPAHAGEYEGPVVENEAQRIKQALL